MTPRAPVTDRLRKLSLCLALAAAGCSPTASSGRRVVVYTSVDEIFAEPIMRQFETETGIKVVLVPDTEETKSTGLLNRLIAEKGRPQADVFWSGDPVRTAVLKAKGVSAPYRSGAADGLPGAYSDADGYWTCFSARARVIIYNTNLVAADQKPTSVYDLADPRFRGKACLGNPLFGTTSMHAAALFEVLGDERARAFFRSMAENGVKILSSNGEVRRRVANGELAIGLTDTDDVQVAMNDGKPVGFVYPDAQGMGTLIVPNAAVLIRGGPNPDEGKRLVDYLIGPKTEAALARGEAAQIPLRPDVDLPDRFPFPPITEVHAMSLDYRRLADKVGELSGGFLKDWVDENM